MDTFHNNDRGSVLREIDAIAATGRQDWRSHPGEKRQNGPPNQHDGQEHELFFIDPGGPLEEVQLLTPTLN